MLDILKLDKYECEAIFVPSGLSLLLIGLSAFPIVLRLLPQTLKSMQVPIELVSSGILLMMFVVGISLWMSFVQTFSKVIVERIIFGYKYQRMPTTRYLLLSDSFGTDAFVKQTRSKIKEDFNISLMPKSKEKEDKAIQLIVRAVGRILQKVQEKSSETLNVKNRRYGQSRNIIGGCTMSFIFSVIAIACCKYFTISASMPICSLVISILICLFPLCFIKSKAEDYANTLFDIYLNTK